MASEDSSAPRYSRLVLSRFRAPRHAGLDAYGGEYASAYAEEGGSGARIQLTATADKATLRALRFRIFGCPHLIAAAELVCERLEGGPVKALTEIDPGELREELEAPVEKTGRFLLLQDALRALARKLNA